MDVTTTNPRAIVPGIGKGYIRELDGLRGIAILLVTMNHFWPPNGPLGRHAGVAHLGWIGVDLFFVISGFLISGILIDTLDSPNYYRNFYARRSLRIFPLYYLFITFLFVVIPLAQRGTYFHTAFIRESGSPAWYYLYLGNIRESVTGLTPAFFLAPLWSLSIEEQFYVLFPLVVARLRIESLGKCMWWLVAIAPLYRLIMMILVPSNSRIQYLSTPSRMDELAIGVLIAIIIRRDTRLPTRRNAAMLFIVLFVLFLVAAITGALGHDQAFGRVLGYSLVGLMFGALVLWTVLSRDHIATSPYGLVHCATWDGCATVSICSRDPAEAL